MEKHKALGGLDRPADVLLSFLFRFGGLDDDISARYADLLGSQSRHSLRKMTTRLTMDTILFSAKGGEADLSGTYKIDQCVSVFGECFRRLLDVFLRDDNNVRDGGIAAGLLERSYLAYLINADRLKMKRRACLAKAGTSKGDEKNQNGAGQSSRLAVSSSQGRPVNASAARSEGKKCPTRASVSPRRSKRPRVAAPPSPPISDDKEADKLMAGYGLQRGPRGALVPRTRPDVEAKAKEKKRLGPDGELMGRASKNRKNKKKQNRDSAQKDFARRHSK